MLKKGENELMIKLEQLENEFPSYDFKDLEFLLEYCGNNLSVTREFLKSNGRKVVRNTLRKFLSGEILAMDVEEEKIEEKVEEI